ncbi:YggT family protein [Psychromonas antarctica]|jgi:YggT family protein|uniref:YggT family protein n=1 Tax=Psychromonas antarctica TaxID=67573 RepID=UPI001EE827D9|nr:YggT family protein [Psychromonas antarctica]MCG6200771.1 YggT family protein [Psychromonas antarctica]
MNAVNFLVNTLFDLYLMVVLLRVWLQVARADFYNPFSQFIIKATQPIVAPLRKLIPSLGGWDTATILFAFAVACLKVVSLILIAGASLNPMVILISGLVILLTAVFKLIFWVLILRAILSWVSRGQNPIEAVMIQLTEPLLAPVRRFIPPMGGLDLSMVVVLIGLQFLEMLVNDLLSRLF